MLRALFLGLLLALGAAAKEPGRKQVSVAMFLWRGPTLAEQGFRETLQASPEFEPIFTVLDAGADRQRLAEQIRAAKTARYDLIYGFGTTVALALQREIKDTPIIFNVVSRPLESGLIASWEHSGNNLTGVSNVVAMDSAFRALRMLVQIRKLGFIYNPLEGNARIQLKEVQEQQQHFGFRLIPIPLTSAEGLIPMLKNTLLTGVDAVLLPSDSLVRTHAQTIVDFLNKYGLPTIATNPELVQHQGAFLGLGPSYLELGRLAALNALRVLGGQRPGDVPSHTGSRLHLVVNLKTARRLGLNLPIQLVKSSELVP